MTIGIGVANREAENVDTGWKSGNIKGEVVGSVGSVRNIDLSNQSAGIVVNFNLVDRQARDSHRAASGVGVDFDGFCEVDIVNAFGLRNSEK